MRWLICIHSELTSTLFFPFSVLSDAATDAAQLAWRAFRSTLGRGRISGRARIRILADDDDDAKQRLAPHVEEMAPPPTTTTAAVLLLLILLNLAPRLLALRATQSLERVSPTGKSVACQARVSGGICILCFRENLAEPLPSETTATEAWAKTNASTNER